MGSSWLCDKPVTLATCISCSSSCKKNFHISCVKIATDVPKLIQVTPGLTWQCALCSNITISQVIADQLDKKMSVFMSVVLEKFNELKSEFSQNKSVLADLLPSIDMKIKETKTIPSYSEKLLGEPRSKFIVKPKNVEQESICTEKALLNSMDLVNKDGTLKVTKLKNLKDGGILVGCSTSSASSVIQCSSDIQFTDSHNIREVKSLSPCVRVVGVSENFDKDSFLLYLKKQNSDLFPESAAIILKKFWPTHSNKKVYQAILQVDPGVYNNLLTASHVLVGLSSCSVYDAIDCTRCFKCNGLNHVSKFCSRVVVCPRCAGAHELSKCPVTDEKDFKCSNCIQLNLRFPELKVNANHAAWNRRSCTAFKDASSKLKSDLFRPVNQV